VTVTESSVPPVAFTTTGFTGEMLSPAGVTSILTAGASADVLEEPVFVEPVGWPGVSDELQAPAKRTPTKIAPVRSILFELDIVPRAFSAASGPHLTRRL
jgi:hypothetical protein